MRNKYYDHIGKEVGRYYKRVGRETCRTVQDAVRSGNLTEIGRAVEYGVQRFAEGPDEPKEENWTPPFSYGGPQEGAPQNDVDGHQSPPIKSQPAYSGSAVRFAFRSRMPGGVSGLVIAIVGALIGIPMLITDIVVIIMAATGSMILSDLAIAAAVFFPISAIALWRMGYGISLRRRARRFARYRDAIGEAAFCSIAELADTTGETKERTKKDLKNMILSGACPQGHLDREETCFMVDNQTYEEYLEAEKAYTARTEAARAKEQKEQADPREAELAAAEKEGGDYLQQIRAANDALPGEVISQKLDRLESVTARIFACVRKHPEKLPDIRRLIRYYMPTTLKLVKSYEEFESQPAQGENITKAKEEIERALDTSNKAFENLLDTLFADDALDVSTDISTLETMLKQEGLTGSDFAKKPEDGKLS